jgi:thiol-disulfide isomerase/thioredoxin
MGKILLPVLALALGLLFGLHQAGLNPFVDPPEASLSEIVLPDVDGVTRNAGQWQGKVVLVNHWASWCPPCIREIPLLVDAQERLGPKGLQVVGIAHDNAEAARTFGDQAGINYPSLVVSTGGSELMISQGNPQGSALPFTAVFDRDGKLAATRLGEVDAEDIDAMVNPLL